MVSRWMLSPSVVLTTATTSTVLRLSEFCPGQPGWAGTRTNIHPLTPILIVNHPLSASSIYCNPWHPSCSIYVPDSLFCTTSVRVFFGLGLAPSTAVWSGVVALSMDEFSVYVLPAQCCNSRYMLWSCIYLSITSQYSVEMAEWIKLFFGKEASLNLSYTF